MQCFKLSIRYQITTKKQKANKTLNYIFVLDQESYRITDKLMYIPNGNTQITPSVNCNQWLKLMDTQL